MSLGDRYVSDACVIWGTKIRLRTRRVFILRIIPELIVYWFYMLFAEQVVKNLIHLDESVFSFLYTYHTPRGIQAMSYITDFFDPVHVLMYTIALILLLWLHKKNTHLYQFVFAMGTGAIIIFLLKYGLRVPRPSHALIQETGYSFASGHAAISAIFFVLIGYMYKNHISNVFLKYSFLALCVAMVFLVSISRVYLGVHYFTDVLAGVAIGAIISAMSIISFNRR